MSAGLLHRRRAPRPTAAGVSVPRWGTSWTAGDALATRAVSLVLATAVVCGPVALLRDLAAPATAPRTAGAAPVGDTVAASEAGEVAQRWVVAWLTTPADQVAALAAWYPEASMAVVSAPPARVDRPAVVSAQLVSPGVWVVLVAADVSVIGAGSGLQVPVRRYFQVPVRRSGSGAASTVSVLGFPAPAPGPAVSGARGVSGGYPLPLAVSSPVGATVSAFLSALVAGAGDLTRYLAPGVAMAPVVPPAAASVRVDSVLAAGDEQVLATDLPPEAAQVQVLAAVDLLDARGLARPSSYAVRLRARAGRWEVVGLDPAPVGIRAEGASAVVVPPPNPSPSPAGSAASASPATTAPVPTSSAHSAVAQPPTASAGPAVASTSR